MTEKGTLKKVLECLERIERGKTTSNNSGRELSDVCSVKGNI